MGHYETEWKPCPANCSGGYVLSTDGGGSLDRCKTCNGNGSIEVKRYVEDDSK